VLEDGGGVDIGEHHVEKCVVHDDEKEVNLN